MDDMDNKDNLKKESVLNILCEKHMTKLLIITLIIQLLTLGSVINLFVKINKQSTSDIEWMEFKDNYLNDGPNDFNNNQVDINKDIAQLISQAKKEIILSIHENQTTQVNEEEVKQWVSEAMIETFNENDKDFGEKFESMTSYFGDKFKTTLDNINDKVNNKQANH